MDIAPINQKTGYVRWMKGQGLPVHVGHGMADLRTRLLCGRKRPDTCKSGIGKADLSRLTGRRI